MQDTFEYWAWNIFLTNKHEKFLSNEHETSSWVMNMKHFSVIYIDILTFVKDIDCTWLTANYLTILLLLELGLTIKTVKMCITY